MTNTIEMPHYICHKQVWALQIQSILLTRDGSGVITPTEEGYSPFGVSKEYIEKHNPQTGGYFIKYADGYLSFSPATAFEEGYTMEINND